MAGSALEANEDREKRHPDSGRRSSGVSGGRAPHGGRPRRLTPSPEMEARLETEFHA